MYPRPFPAPDYDFDIYWPLAALREGNVVALGLLAAAWRYRGLGAAALVYLAVAPIYVKRFSSEQ